MSLPFYILQLVKGVPFANGKYSKGVFLPSTSVTLMYISPYIYLSTHMKGEGMLVGNFEFNPFHMGGSPAPPPYLHWKEYTMISTLEHFKGAELQCLSSR